MFPYRVNHPSATITNYFCNLFKIKNKQYPHAMSVINFTSTVYFFVCPPISIAINVTLTTAKKKVYKPFEPRSKITIAEKKHIGRSIITESRTTAGLSSARKLIARAHDSSRDRWNHNTCAESTTSILASYHRAVHNWIKAESAHARRRQFQISIFTR